MLIEYGHADAGGRSRLVALEQGEQFRAQTIAAGCSDGVHGEEWDHDLPKLHERRIIAVTVICQIERRHLWSLECRPGANTPLHDSELARRPDAPILRQQTECGGDV